MIEPFGSADNKVNRTIPHGTEVLRQAVLPVKQEKAEAARQKASAEAVASANEAAENLSESPRGRGGNSVFFGKRINALTTYLNVVQYMPYQRLQSFYKDIFNLKLSQGTISNIIQKMNKKASDALYLIKQHISTSKVVGFDESGCFCQERLDWSWIAQTPYATLVFRALGRGSKVLEDMFGESLKDITAVTDRHSAYFKLDFDNHQICMAHILREIKYLDELDTTQSNYSANRIGILLTL